MASTKIVATWTLGSTQRKAAEASLVTTANIANPTDHHPLPENSATIANIDSQFPAKHAGPGGNYYSTAKLQVKYEGQTPDDPRYAMGSGWLITPKVLVTAGHCAYDHQYGLGRASEVKVSVGYHGKESVGRNSSAQFRSGVKIATSKEWVDSGSNRVNDVSFIQVDSDFENAGLSDGWQAGSGSGREVGPIGAPGGVDSSSGYDAMLSVFDPNNNLKVIEVKNGITYVEVQLQSSPAKGPTQDNFSKYQLTDSKQAGSIVW